MITVSKGVTESVRSLEAVLTGIAVGQGTAAAISDGMMTGAGTVIALGVTTGVVALTAAAVEIITVVTVVISTDSEKRTVTGRAAVIRTTQQVIRVQTDECLGQISSEAFASGVDKTGTTEGSVRHRRKRSCNTASGLIDHMIAGVVIVTRATNWLAA